MSRAIASISLTALVLALGACSGPLVNVAPVLPASYSEGDATSGEACGMLVFGVIPVSLNDRVERAYELALESAHATSLTDTAITEEWTFTPIGPELCSTVAGTAIIRSAGDRPAQPAPRAEMRGRKRAGTADTSSARSD